MSDADSVTISPEALASLALHIDRMATLTAELQRRLSLGTTEGGYTGEVPIGPENRSEPVDGLSRIGNALAEIAVQLRRMNELTEETLT